MDSLRLLAQIKNQPMQDFREIADQEDAKLADGKVTKEEGGNTTTGKPEEKPTTSECSADHGLVAHGVDRKGAIDTEANTRRLELENTMVSNFLTNKP
jgi:hypothetical protein